MTQSPIIPIVTLSLCLYGLIEASNNKNSPISSPFRANVAPLLGHMVKKCIGCDFLCCQQYTSYNLLLLWFLTHILPFVTRLSPFGYGQQHFDPQQQQSLLFFTHKSSGIVLDQAEILVLQSYLPIQGLKELTFH